MPLLNNETFRPWLHTCSLHGIEVLSRCIAVGVYQYIAKLIAYVIRLYQLAVCAAHFHAAGIRTTWQLSLLHFSMCIRDRSSIAPNQDDGLN